MSQTNNATTQITRKNREKQRKIIQSRKKDRKGILIRSTKKEINKKEDGIKKQSHQ